MSTADAAPAVTVPERAVRAPARKRPRQGQSPWIWLAVVLIVLFCLFPFYWLINVSLKTGPDLSSASLEGTSQPGGCGLPSPPSLSSACSRSIG